jgi:glutamate-1-semialdehyde 2,1-aminomutase/spore coat polysaccharide biosynthesis protein SpsF
MAPGIDEIVIATSTLEADDVIEAHCKKIGVACFRGSETDVLDRYYLCAIKHEADVVLRLTCDCPFLDPAVIGEVIKLREITGSDYASNVDPPSYPDGLDVEVFTFAALKTAWLEAVRPSDRDTVTQYISRNRFRFKVVNATCPIPGLAKERWVLDTEADWEFCKELGLAMVFDEGGGTEDQYNTSTYLKISDILKKRPDIRKLNEGGVRNERFHAALAEEEIPARDFSVSSAMLARARAVIPFGAQTFSKSYLQFPAGHHPLYVTHGDGARVFDVDGNDYVDLVGAILPVVLGYRDPDVDEAIRRQLDRGISFSLATELEVELAEKLCQIIPCAEMVKFGKTGTDVTSAAIRLARAYTGRDKVAVGGYHGWADWSMATTNRNLGIPQDVARNSVPLKDLSDLNIDYAAVIVEPNDDPEYLEKLQSLCSMLGIVLIFDEIITGFRYSMGGAQKLFGVTPDLATFGKAMANGMPLSAIVGRRDIMKLMEPPDNIFYSGTFFGETLSLAASLATINKLERVNGIDTLWVNGIAMRAIAQNAISSWKLNKHIKLSGLAPRMTLSFSNDKIRTLFLMSMAEQGVLIINSHNVSLAHNGPWLRRIETAYDETCGLIRCAIDNGGIDDFLSDIPIVSAAPLRKANER